MFALALTFFLVANPIGNSPAIIALVKDFDFRRQRIILLREALFSLILALFFQYMGEWFLGMLSIQDFAVTLAGGSLLFIVSLSMIFSHGASEEELVSTNKQEPYIVPIATPILSGPGLLAVIMLKSKLEPSNFKITAAILIAWAGVVAVLATAPYMQKFLGKRGLAALEQIMGMILAMISVEMLVKGSALLIQTFEA
ncbi:MAG: MarC family protein [Parachlamydiaceae bacterium]|nr:MarC family protein [Parachlamydiaceae bacterium]